MANAGRTLGTGLVAGACHIQAGVSNPGVWEWSLSRSQLAQRRKLLGELGERAGRHSQFVGVLRVVPGTKATTKGLTDSLLIGRVDRRAPFPCETGRGGFP